MAALQFQNQDKENVEGFITTNRAKGNRQALGNTSILQNRVKSIQNTNVSAFMTPRKTLGDILNSQQTPHTIKGQSLKPVGVKPALNLQKSSIKSKKNVSFRSRGIQEKENIKKPKQVLAPVSMKIESKQRKIECDDIEFMHPPEDVDKDDRYPPQEERVSNYLNKLISWRPPCLFGIPPVSEDEDEEAEERQRKERREALFDLDNLDALAGIEPFEEEPRFNEEDLSGPAMLEVDIPYIDETLPTLDDSLPSLDDSYSCNISPSLGVLQLNDSVL
ncbi:hypothetical protein SNE40_007849 [Patella caerulea]|uniref:Securin n=1 Tax=Patella caerulea TaxID=87958 RepID=A0AAN8PVP0_PATCE